MERYIEFNPLKFINESVEWDSKLKKAEKRLDEILELRGQSDSVGRGSEISNPTELINMEKADVEEQIARIKCYQRIYKDAWAHLTKEEQVMIDGFFFKKYGKVRDFVNNFAQENCTNKSYVYNARKEAIRKFTTIINENYIYINKEKI